MKRATAAQHGETGRVCPLNMEYVTYNTFIFTALACVILHHKWGISPKFGPYEHPRTVREYKGPRLTCTD